MIITVEIENTEDFATVKSSIEKIKGVKSVRSNSVELAGDGVPMWVYEELEKYADQLKPEDCISEEEFFKNAREKVCKLYSQK